MADELQKVFIGYAREDEAVAIRLYNDLTSAGLDVWIDKKSLLAGQEWRSTIRKAIKDSRYFISLISRNSVPKRGFVQKELKIALDILDEFPESDIYIIPVRLDESEPSQEELRSLHWVDMFPNWQEGLEKILKSIRIYPIEPAIIIEPPSKLIDQDTDLRILKALPMSGRSFFPVFQALGKLGIDDVELGDRLELLAKKGLVQVVGLGGSYAPGMTLSNGIHDVGLTAKGRQLIREEPKESMDDIDKKILGAIASLRRSFPNADEINKLLGLDPGLLGDRLEIMEKTKGYVKTLSGTYGPGSLPNGIYAAGLTAEGRMFLRGKV